MNSSNLTDANISKFLDLCKKMWLFLQLQGLNERLEKSKLRINYYPYTLLRKGGYDVHKYGNEIQLLFIVANQATHTFPGTMNLGFDSTHWKIQLFSNLLIGVILQKTHGKELSVLLWKAIYVIFDLAALLNVYQVILG